MGTGRFSSRSIQQPDKTAALALASLPRPSLQSWKVSQGCWREWGADSPQGGVGWSWIGKMHIAGWSDWSLSACLGRGNTLSLLPIHLQRLAGLGGAGSAFSGSARLFPPGARAEAPPLKTQPRPQRRDHTPRNVATPLVRAPAYKSAGARAQPPLPAARRSARNPQAAEASLSP